MNKKKKEIIITAVLVVVLAIVFLMSIKKKPSSGKKTSSLTETIKNKSKLNPLKSVKASKDIVALQLKRAQLPWGRDPFSLAKSKKAYEGRHLMLKGISLDDKGNGYAFINDKIVTAGDVISGYKVIEVKNDKVLLKKGEDSFYLGMPKE